MTDITITVNPKQEHKVRQAVGKYLKRLETYGISHDFRHDNDMPIPTYEYCGVRLMGLTDITSELKSLVGKAKPIDMILEELNNKIVYDPKGLKPLTTKEIEDIQRKYHQKYFDLGSDFETIRHITLHMGKLNGKLSSYCEAYEHYLKDGEKGKRPSTTQVTEEVIPDLLIYCAELAILTGYNNMTPAYIMRLWNNVRARHEKK